MDAIDAAILRLVQNDATLSLDDIASAVGASKTPVWNRLKRLKEEGIIRREVAIVDPDKIGLEACFFVLVKTSEHDGDWQARFLSALKERTEVIEAHRLAAKSTIYLSTSRNPRAYDRFYQSLISEVKVFNVTALLSMEELKYTTPSTIEPQQR